MCSTPFSFHLFCYDCTMVNKRKIFFIRHAKLNLSYRNHSEMPFEVIADLATGALDPGIDHGTLEQGFKKLSQTIPFEKLEVMYTGPSKRTRETGEAIAKLISSAQGRKIKPAILPQLREVAFDIRSIIPFSERASLKIDVLNEAVLSAMVRGEYAESASHVYERVDKLFNIIRFPDRGDSLLISHDFYMRVIEIYIKRHGESDHNITIGELRGTRQNSYLHGFVTDISLNSFSGF